MAGVAGLGGRAPSDPLQVHQSRSIQVAADPARPERSLPEPLTVLSPGIVLSNALPSSEWWALESEQASGSDRVTVR